MLSNPQTSNPIMLSARLGWLAVEAFGRLRRWVRTGRRPVSAGLDATHRFTFSDREPVLYEQLLISLRQLRQIARQLVPDLPPPVPEDLEPLLESARQNIGTVWAEFDAWSQEAWNTLQVQDALSGQAFSAGGSLADTFWHAEGAGVDKLPDRLKELLRLQRLEGIADRFDALGESLPDHTAVVIHHSLYRWRRAAHIQDLDEAHLKRFLERLEAQAKVWRDLLFGQQRAEDYLTADDRRATGRNAFLATLVLGIIAALFAWLAVLVLSGLGRALLAAILIVLRDPEGTGSALAGELFDWQTWTTLLATLSSVVVVFSGFINRLSGWMIAFYRSMVNRLTLEKIYRRTFRGWEE